MGNKFEVGEWGLTFKDQLTPKDWIEAVWQLQKFDGKIQWYLGDLAVYAESQGTGWGESKYTDLIEATGYEYKTLRNYATVARRFSPLFRQTILESVPLAGQVSWSHFAEVTSLDDNFAVYWLQKAGNNGWGRNKLREEIRLRKIGVDDPDRVALVAGGHEAVSRLLDGVHVPRGDVARCQHITMLFPLEWWAIPMITACLAQSMSSSSLNPTIPITKKLVRKPRLINGLGQE